MRLAPPSRRGALAAVMAATVALSFAGSLAAQETLVDATGLIRDGDAKFREKNYRQAASDYEKALSHASKLDIRGYIGRRVVICKLRLGQFDEAVSAARATVRRSRGTPREAIAERALGNLYMLLPHWGTRSGGVFRRGQRTQGLLLRSWRHDKKRAVLHLERARALFARYDGDAEALEPLPEDVRDNWRAERIGCLLDLASCCCRFGIYENDGSFWFRFWGERDDALAKTAGEQDFDEYYSNRAWRRKRPIGLRLDTKGQPLFPATPSAYSSELPDDEKMLFLLVEVRELDTTPDRRYAALSYYRQAMLARTRFGMDRLNVYSRLYYADGRYPIAEALKRLKPWELRDNQALALAGGKARVVALPASWDVLRLLGLAAGDGRASDVAAQALYAAALYRQSRQQYRQALEQYEDLRKRLPENAWSKKAAAQIERIRKPEIHIDQAGLQLAGSPTRLQVGYRNVSKLWFVARRIDLKGFLTALRDNPMDGTDQRLIWSALSNWSRPFTAGYRAKSSLSDLAARYLGPEVARWSDDVRDDESHRFAQVTTQTPLEDRGAYLIFAFASEPAKDLEDKPPADALKSGLSRAVLAVSDLAYVEKRTRSGNLYFVTDARTGAPVADATVQALETWSRYESRFRRVRRYRRMHNLSTDRNGLTLFTKSAPRHSSTHLLIEARGGRLAWTGMSYWTPYRPSREREGLFAYCVTDRPVYRPGQTVHFKFWLRRKLGGSYISTSGTEAQVTVYDPRGDPILRKKLRADDFGGASGELDLGDEARLGVYRIYIRGERYAGGRNFRVEEYRKPQFNVEVKPGKEIVRLGGRIRAVVKASYYFGGPVARGSVRYRVFRQECRQSHYFPGPWDWLYGAGYGLPWYPMPWHGWWREAERCWAPPPAFGRWGTPVRELVMEGSGRTDTKGELTIEIDTGPALTSHADRDHQYIIQAEVRDLSRRVVSAEGSVKATRQSIYVFVRPDRGYCRPGEQAQVRIQCMTADGRPVQARGVVTVSSMTFGAGAGAEGTEIKRWSASTDAGGSLVFPLGYDRSGRLVVSFETPDPWGALVRGRGALWFCGRDFDGRLYRFNDLEFITDKRVYKPGDTARVMVSSRRADAHVLFSDDVDRGFLLSWKVLSLPRKSLIVNVPIRDGHTPNFFIEGTMVADGRMHKGSAQICVPPARGVMQVSLKTDKPRYKPGERARVTLTAKTPDGAPVAGQFALTVFDEALLQIQRSFGVPIAQFFHGRLRRYLSWSSTNLQDRFAVFGLLTRPYQALYPTPDGWSGVWGLQVPDWRTITEEQFEALGLGLRKLDATRVAAGVSAPGFAGVGAMGGGAGLAKGAEAADGAMATAPNAPAARKAAPGREFAEAKVRTQFADTAVWIASLTTDFNGVAKATLKMPENLTRWRLQAWGMDRGVRVGEGEGSAVTTKGLIVQLQGPRFLVEFDEVVLSAVVHNHLKDDKRCRVSIEVPPDLLKPYGGGATLVERRVEAGGETRVDWRFRVLKPGRAKVTVKALTDRESDAMSRDLPLLVHGMAKQVTAAGEIRASEPDKTVAIEIDVPARRRIDATRLEVRFAPSLVASMLDALPYCIGYPYHTSESDVSRFVPAALTWKILQDLGLKIEDLRGVKGRLEEVKRRTKEPDLAKLYDREPVFDSARLRALVVEGVRRLVNTQNADGGWGWGPRGDSSLYMTCYVLEGLHTARRCDAKVQESAVTRGLAYLERELSKAVRRVGPEAIVNPGMTYLAYTLSLSGRRAAARKRGGRNAQAVDVIDSLWKGRDRLGVYGKALLGLTLANLKKTNQAEIVLQNIMQYREENAETRVAWFRTPSAGWWYWWNSDIEANAAALRLVTRLRPQSDLGPKLVRWLLNNRRNGYYWRSTRDTTRCVAAMAAYARASGETQPRYAVTLDYDNGASRKTVKVTKANALGLDNRLVISGAAVKSGKRALKITRRGRGALYYSVYLRYFTKEVPIPAAGSQLKVDRSYYLLKRIPFTVEVENAAGRKVREPRLRYERAPLRKGDRLKSGQIIQVQMRVTTDNDYTYLCLEDMKPAGCEPVDQRSGGLGQEGFSSYAELRDEKVALFVASLSRGTHLLRYRLRAETPGLFHALPTRFYGVYAPELRANSAEARIRIVDN